MELDPKVIKVAEALGDLFNQVTGNEKNISSPLADVAMFLLAKTMRTQISLLELAKIGMPEDMLPLIRSLYETSVTLEYMGNHAEEAEIKRFIAQASIMRAKILKSMIRIKAKDPRLTTKKIQEIYQEAADMKKKYLKGYVTYSKWDRLEESIRRALHWAPKKSDPSLPQKASIISKQSKLHYEFVYPLLSAYTHPHSYAAISYLKETKTGIRIPFDEPNFSTANAYFMQGAGYILVTLRQYNQIQQSGIPETEFLKVLDIMSKK